MAERLESIRYGFEQMHDHALGTGPGMSFLDNPYFVPHQFAVAQGSDLGPLGMVCVILLSMVVLVKVIRLDLRRRRAHRGHRLSVRGVHLDRVRDDRKHRTQLRSHDDVVGIARVVPGARCVVASSGDEVIGQLSAWSLDRRGTTRVCCRGSVSGRSARAR